MHDAVRVDVDELSQAVRGVVQAQVITEFSIGISPNADPFGITAGPDGNLWFTESAGRIGRITPSGVVTEFSAGISSLLNSSMLRSQLALSSQSYPIRIRVPKGPVSAIKRSNRRSTSSTLPAIICSPIKKSMLQSASLMDKSRL